MNRSLKSETLYLSPELVHKCDPSGNEINVDRDRVIEILSPDPINQRIAIGVVLFYLPY